jgi:hypothetical protein
LFQEFYLNLPYHILRIELPEERGSLKLQWQCAQRENEAKPEGSDERDQLSRTGLIAARRAAPDFDHERYDDTRKLLKIRITS